MILRDIFVDPKFDKQVAELVLAPYQKAGLRLMHRCGSGALGSHLRCCTACGARVTTPNCCRSVACLFCGGARRFAWARQQSEDLLPVPYFHVVFTAPPGLRGLFQQAPAVIGRALFAAAKSTLLALSADPRYLGATPAILATMHTWNQRLEIHPHIHCLVSAGGLDDQGCWRHARWNKSKRRSFFAPGRIIAAHFRKTLYRELRRCYRSGECADLADPTGHLASETGFCRWIARELRVCRHVHCEATARDAQAVIRYLSAYVARVAIAPQRVISYADERVTLRVRPRRQESGSADEILSLPLSEFLTRLGRHWPPPRFHRHRGWGLLANSVKAKALATARSQLQGASTTRAPAPAVEIAERYGPACPHCGGTLVYLSGSHQYSDAAHEEDLFAEHFLDFIADGCTTGSIATNVTIPNRFASPAPPSQPAA